MLSPDCNFIYWLLLSPVLVGLLSPLVKLHRLSYHLLSGAVVLYNLFWLLGHHDLLVLEPIPPLLDFHMDRYTWFFMIITNTMWGVTLLYSYDYTNHHFRREMPWFYFYLGLSMGAVSGAALAGNLLTLAVFYLLAVVSGYFLVTIRGDKHSLLLGGIYWRNTLLPGLILFLPTAMYIALLTQNRTFSEIPTLGIHLDHTTTSILIVLLVLGMSVNLVFPFHSWLPKIWSTPAPATALLHSVGTVNLGAIVLLKITVYVFGLPAVAALSDNFSDTGWLLYAFGLNAVYAAWLAWKTDIMKQRFSYSTVSQLSYILTALLLGTKVGVLAALVHIFTHALAKSCLFYVAGYYNMRIGSMKLPVIAPYLPHTRWVAGVVALCGASIIGFPLLAGSHSKDLMLLEEFNTHHYASVFFLVVGSFINIIYIWPVVKNAFLTKRENGYELAPPPPAMVAAIALCAVLLISYSFYIPFLLQYL